MYTHILCYKIFVSMIPDGFVVETRFYLPLLLIKHTMVASRRKKSLLLIQFFFHNEEIGSTDTFEKYRERGLALIVNYLPRIVKRIAWEVSNQSLKKNVPPYAFIGNYNTASRRTYTKVLVMLFIQPPSWVILQNSFLSRTMATNVMVTHFFLTDRML